jgi:hypothetical protein
MGQVKELSCDSDGQPLTGIEAKKPHARSPASLYMGPQIELRESVQHWDVWHQARRDALHGERDGTHVGLPVEQIEFQAAGNQTAKGRGLHPPVREKQIAPPHPNGPGRAGAGQGLWLLPSLMRGTGLFCRVAEGRRSHCARTACDDAKIFSS